MKKCPKCKAEIQEKARFCLYCMTSFEEKQTIETKKENNLRWVYLAAVLVLALIVLCVFLFTQKSNTAGEADDTFTSSSVSSNFNNSTGSSEATPNRSENNQSENTETSVPSNTSHETVTSDGTSTGSSSEDDQTESDNSDNNSTPSTSSDTVVTVTYSYRVAKYGDDFSVGANLENAVVITGVKTASPNGVYEIPETLDGKRVIAIMSLAFCDDNISNTVKSVIVPSSVKTIWNNAFANCYNLTDIYFKGTSIYTETNAFPETSKRNGTLTIHCSANCSDRNYRYYKNSASYYDAKYEEWNG